MLQRAQKLDDILLSYTNVSEEAYLVLILIPNKNPTSKSIKNYFDLRNLGIIANVKTLSLRARFLFILF